MDVVVTQGYINSLLGAFEPVVQSSDNLPCYFMKLPSELKLAVVEYLTDPKDLYSLSLTCRVLEAMALSRLYRTVNVGIPEDGSPTWNTGSYVTIRPHILKAVQNITIKTERCSTRQLFCNRWTTSTVGSGSSYACQTIGKIPMNHLKSFSFTHRSTLTHQVMDLLCRRQGESLEHLHFFEIYLFPSPETTLPSRLRTIECRSIHNAEAIGQLVQANRETIETLYLGQEKDLAEKYRRIRGGYHEQTPQPLTVFKTLVDISKIPHLRKLSLVGVDVSPLVPVDIEDALYLTRLTALTIESCNNCAGFISTLGTIFNHIEHDPDTSVPNAKPVLRFFVFRHETITSVLKESLVMFLESFSGLRKLSMLFENATLLVRPSRLIAGHGPTLRTLCLETRIQPRDQLALDTSRPFGMGGYNHQLWEESIHDICTLCPDLEELGMGFPWNDEMVRLRRSMLPTLQSLRTIHIRNFPESQMHMQVGDYTMKEYAVKFVDWIYASAQLNGESQPMLETLSIGPTLYESRWKGSNKTRSQPPEFLRTHHFALDWARTRFGRWNALVTGVSEKYMEEIREERPLNGVFEQVWLR